MEQQGKIFHSLAMLYLRGVWIKEINAPTIQKSDLQDAVVKAIQKALGKMHFYLFWRRILERAGE